MAIPFRLVVVDDPHNSTEIVTLRRAPDIGNAFLFATFESVRVFRVITIDDPAVAGIIPTELGS